MQGLKGLDVIPKLEVFNAVVKIGANSLLTELKVFGPKLLN